jgi:hypothetical protein
MIELKTVSMLWVKLELNCQQLASYENPVPPRARAIESDNAIWAEHKYLKIRGHPIPSE